MPTSGIVTSTRFMDIGVTKVYYIPMIAAASLIPTRAEMNAGTDLSRELSDWAGWVVTAELLDVQPMNSPFRSMIPGTLSAPNSSLSFYTSKTGVDVRTVLPKTTTGFIMILDGGDVTGNRAEVWPVAVASVSVVRGVINDAGGGASTDLPSMVMVSFAVTAAPAQNVSVP